MTATETMQNCINKIRTLHKRGSADLLVLLPHLLMEMELELRRVRELEALFPDEASSELAGLYEADDTPVAWLAGLLANIPESDRCPAREAR